MIKEVPISSRLIRPYDIFNTEYMQCKSCKAFFGSPPCPECGWKGIKASEEDSNRSMEETLVKPSQILSDNDDKSNVDESSLLIPSEVIKEKQTNQQSGEKLRKPSDIVKEQQEVERTRKPSDIVKDQQEVERTRKPSDILKDQQEVERLRKPSEVLKEMQPQTIEEEHLRKPSEVINKKLQTEKPEYRGNLQSPSEIDVKSTIQPKPVELAPSITSKGDGLLRPSELRGTSGRAEVTKIKQSVSMMKNDINIAHKGKGDENFRKDVKQTLEEVINLLEKLIED